MPFTWQTYKEYTFNPLKLSVRSRHWELELKKAEALDKK